MNVKFFFSSTLDKYLALAEKNPLALYFITDENTGENYLFKGDKLIAAGHEATETAAGLMSAADKIKLNTLVASTTSTLEPVDGSIIIESTENGRSIKVNVSNTVGNAIIVKEDGLFVPTAEKTEIPEIPEFEMELQDSPDVGFYASYRLKRTVGDKVSYVGDTVNIPMDKMLKSGSMDIVIIADQPYVGAVVGDAYLDLVLNDEDGTHVYIPVNGIVSPVEISKDKANGLTFVDGKLSLSLATTESAGAMSAEDKLFIDTAPLTFATKKETDAIFNRIEYEVFSKPEGAVVNYRDKEIRVMCPEDIQWVKQDVGVNGNANMYYMGFKAYAPDGAVSFKEDDKIKIEDKTMYYFENNDFAGIDEFGRKYSIRWLAIAEYEEDTDTWTYFGSESSTEQYAGWYYSVEWYNADGIIISSDLIRINLTNEECHHSMVSHAITEELQKIQASIENVEESYTWGELF